MKILVIRETNPFVQSTATNNRLLTLLLGLLENGCEIELLILNGYYSKDEKNNFGKLGIHNKVKYNYVLPVDFSNFFTRQFYYRLLPVFILKNKIKQVINHNNYDFVWMNFDRKVIESGIPILKANKNIKFIHERDEFSWIGFNNKSLHELYLSEFLPRIKILLVMTSNLMDYYKKIVGEDTKILKLPMTVDLSRFENVKINENLPHYIGYCGMMNNAKDGVDILIKSFIEIKDDFPDLFLYLAGPLLPKKDYQLQKDIITSSKIESRVVFLGELSRNEIPEFLKNAKILALSRPNSKQAEGGFPTKLGEYLAAGKPVCVTKVGEIESYLTDNVSAYLAEPSTINSFADKLRIALTDKNSLMVGEKGKEIAEVNFNKEIQANTLYKYLKEQIDNK